MVRCFSIHSAILIQNSIVKFFPFVSVFLAFNQNKTCCACCCYIQHAIHPSIQTMIITIIFNRFSYNHYNLWCATNKQTDQILLLLLLFDQTKKKPIIIVSTEILSVLFSFHFFRLIIIENNNDAFVVDNNNFCLQRG